MTFKLSERSLNNLEGVHPDLAKVVHRAIEITPYDFVIIEGLRSVEKEKAMVAAGKSQTMHSRHLTGKAVDFMALVNGKGTWETKYYEQIANAFLQAGAELNIPVVWGGSWKTIKDNDHIELNRNFYK
jgi:peptidoglycan L-alanyl-D-glutamate endopeptidase CwlK